MPNTSVYKAEEVRAILKNVRATGVQLSLVSDGKEYTQAEVDFLLQKDTMSKNTVLNVVFLAVGLTIVGVLLTSWIFQLSGWKISYEPGISNQVSTKVTTIVPSLTFSPTATVGQSQTLMSAPPTGTPVPSSPPTLTRTTTPVPSPKPAALPTNDPRFKVRVSTVRQAFLDEGLSTVFRPRPEDPIYMVSPVSYDTGVQVPMCEWAPNKRLSVLRCSETKQGIDKATFEIVYYLQYFKGDVYTEGGTPSK